MSNEVQIETRFKQPLYLMAKAIKMAEVPMIFLSGADLARFVEQSALAFRGTVIYTSQSDFEDQMLASMSGFDYLFVVIDTPLTKRRYQLVHAYLAARDITGADDSLLSNLGVEHLADEHRLALFVDRAAFAAQDATMRGSLSELCTQIAVN